MQQLAKLFEEPLPLRTAVLSHVALSLFMWNIALRMAGLLLHSVTTGSL